MTDDDVTAEVEELEGDLRRAEDEVDSIEARLAEIRGACPHARREEHGFFSRCLRCNAAIYKDDGVRR